MRKSVRKSGKAARRSAVSRLWYEFLCRILQLAAVLACRIRHTGRRNIPATGGVLLVSNHQSYLDPPFVGIGCPRQMNYLARQSLFKFAPFSWLIESLDVIPLDREGIGVSGMKESLRRLKRGEMLVIFPEGRPLARRADRAIYAWLHGPGRPLGRVDSSGGHRRGVSGVAAQPHTSPFAQSPMSITAGRSHRPK